LSARVASGRLDDFFRSVTRSDLETDTRNGAADEAVAESPREERIAS